MRYVGVGDAESGSGEVSRIEVPSRLPSELDSPGMSQLPRRTVLGAAVTGAVIAGSVVSPQQAAAVNADAVFNPRDYGGVGDGGHDDTDALKAALAAATNGGRVVLPDGVWTFAESLLMPLGSVLQGSGLNRWAANGGSRLLATHADACLVMQTQCHIQDLMLDGNFIANWGIYSGYGHTMTMSNIQVIKCVEASFVFDATQNSTMVSCTSSDSPIGYALYNGCQVLEFYGCTSDNSANGGLGFGGNTARAILITDDSTDPRMGGDRGLGNGSLTFFGGIYERGPGDYRVEILKGRGSTIRFIGAVVGGSSPLLASLHVGPNYSGDVLLADATWSAVQDGGVTQLVFAEGGNIYIRNMLMSGAAGRNIISKTTVSGTATIRFDECARTLINSTFDTGLSGYPGATWTNYNEGTGVWNATKKCMDMSLPSTTAGVYSSLAGSAYYAAGQAYGSVTIRFRIADATGLVRLSWGSEFIGAFGNGAHEIVVPLGGTEQRLVFTSEAASGAVASLMYLRCEHGGETGGASPVIQGTATLDFGAIAAVSFADLTITVTGALVGEPVSLGIPPEAMEAGITYTGWVSATDTVTVRAQNGTAGDLAPRAGVFKAALVT